MKWIVSPEPLEEEAISTTDDICFGHLCTTHGGTGSCIGRFCATQYCFIDL